MKRSYLDGIGNAYFTNYCIWMKILYLMKPLVLLCLERLESRLGKRKTVINCLLFKRYSRGIIFVHGCLYSTKRREKLQHINRVRSHYANYCSVVTLRFSSFQSLVSSSCNCCCYNEIAIIYFEIFLVLFHL